MKNALFGHIVRHAGMLPKKNSLFSRCSNNQLLSCNLYLLVSGINSLKTFLSYIQ